jgi:hypothetical protein
MLPTFWDTEMSVTTILRRVNPRRRRSNVRSDGILKSRQDRDVETAGTRQQLTQNAEHPAREGDPLRDTCVDGGMKLQERQSTSMEGWHAFVHILEI